MTRQPHLLTATEDAVLVVTLNRPEKLNVLDAEIFSLLESALHRFRDSPELKVMLIRATGRYFCAGADLISRGGADSPAMGNTGSSIREFHRLRLNGMRRIYDEMEAVEKPIVVAHHAMCMGGGLELSLSCDFRLAAASANYAFPEAKIGVLPASGGVSRLTRIVGTHWARYLIMANLPVDAARALQIGLVHEVYPDASFDEDAMNFCRHIARQDAEQMGAAKLAIEMAMDVGLAQARNVERLANSALMLSPDYLARIEQYIKGIGQQAADSK